MKATELRIGNLAYDKVSKELLIVCGLNCDSDGKNSKIEFSVLDRSKYPLPDGWSAEPIPLNEQWLLNFGFEKNIYTELFKKNGHQIDLSVIKCLFYLTETADWYKEIEYVHQLQNLYHALTGEELTLKNTHND
jgi:hypothetical protein